MNFSFNSSGIKLANLGYIIALFTGFGGTGVTCQFIYVCDTARQWQ
jgi:hypothetical protein